jgi:hypothetical protein
MELSRRHHRIPGTATTTTEPPNMPLKMLLLRFTDAQYPPLVAVSQTRFHEATAGTCHS